MPVLLIRLISLFVKDFFKNSSHDAINTAVKSGRVTAIENFTKINMQTFGIVLGRQSLQIWFENYQYDMKHHVADVSYSYTL